MMTKRRITVSIDEEIVTYLDQVPNRSAVVAEAVREYRTRQLERELEAAYREDREETARIAEEWEAADAPFDADPDDAE
jgi:metal-responsive CopG/Arc/MetJ family transcriptional regulator